MSKSTFRQQRYNARKRGIKFEFSYVSWVAWWEEQLGPDWLAKRGCRRGQYVMSRYKDQGAYVIDNVKCILAENNHVEYNLARKPQKRWSKPLTDEVVLAIYESDLPYAIIVDELKEFRVTAHKIQCIKRKRYFKKTTNEFAQMKQKKTDEDESSMSS